MTYTKSAKSVEQSIAHSATLITITTNTMRQLINNLKELLKSPLATDRNVKGHSLALLKRLQELNPLDGIPCTHQKVNELGDCMTCMTNVREK